MGLSAYRRKWAPESNVPRDTRICGGFTLTTNGAAIADTIRPASVSDSTPFLYTVTQQGSWFSATNGSIYQITLVENYLAPSDTTSGNYCIYSDAVYNPVYASGSGGSNPAATTVVTCATMLDSTTNSFVIILTNTSGTIQTVTSGWVGFEICLSNSNSPPSQ